MHTSRNEPCPCGSGKKYKKCCLRELKRVPFHEPVFIMPLYPEVDEESDRAFSFLEEDDVASAQEIANRLLDLYSDSHIVHFLQGVCFIKKEQWGQAIESLERSVQIFPLFSEGYFNLGSLYRQNMMLPMSVACFRKVIDIEGTSSDLGQKAEAELAWLENIIHETYEISLEAYLERHRLFDMAFENLKSKNYEIAIEQFKEVLEKEASHVQSHGNIALAYAHLGNKITALEHLDKALSIDPTYEPACLNRAIIAKLKEGERLDATIVDVRYLSRTH